MFPVYEEDFTWNHSFNDLFIFSFNIILNIYYILVTGNIMINKTDTVLVMCDVVNRVPGSP